MDLAENSKASSLKSRSALNLTLFNLKQAGSKLSFVVVPSGFYIPLFM